MSANIRFKSIFFQVNVKIQRLNIPYYYNVLGAFERKILTAIFGPTNENGEWRIKYNNELYTLYKESDIVTYIKISRLRWAGRHSIGGTQPCKKSSLQ
jgi:hypothetical protein